MLAFRGSRRVIYAAVLMSASISGVPSFCDARKGGVGGDKDKSPSDFLNDFAKRGKAAMDSVDPSFSNRFQTLLPENVLQDASKKAHEILSNGVPGQIGYGFLMGYSSGFCLKKVSKIRKYFKNRYQIKIKAPPFANGLILLY